MSSISGYSLVQHSYRILPKVRLITCIITCQNDPECYSLNFRLSLRQCELSNGTRLSIAPEYFVPSVDTVYFDNLYRPYKPCDMTPCKNKGSCVIINSYPGYKCDCQKGYFGPRCEGRYDKKSCNAPKKCVVKKISLIVITVCSVEKIGGFYSCVPSFDSRGFRITA